MESDTLSDTLMKIKLKSSAAGVLDAAGKWAVQYPHFDGFKLHVLLKGERYVLIEENSKVLHLRAGAAGASDWAIQRWKIKK